MTKRHGYALLAALIAVVVVVSAAIYYLGAASGNGGRDAFADGRVPHNPAAPASAGTWVGAWSTSPAGAEPGTVRNGLAGRSLRNVIHAGTGGTSARITLSNLYGHQPLTISHASLAVAATPNSPTAAAGTLRRLTFAGHATVRIPAGQQVVSDVAAIVIPYDSDVLVTTYSPTPSGPVTYHPRAQQTSYAALGDRTQDTNGAAYTEQTPYWRYVTALDVLSNESNGTIVAIGDSLTDGSTSSVGENRRWTDALTARLRAADAGVPRYTVVNQGISGNRVLTAGSVVAPVGRGESAGIRIAQNPSGLSRFGRDVLGRTNVKAVVIALGVNDILRTPHQTDPRKITDGLRLLVRQAHARGLKVIGATLMPFRGHRGYQGGLDAVRRDVNAEIRDGAVFDAVVDFDKALQDPYDPRRLRADYDSGDHLHPSDKGYLRMADAFRLKDFKGSPPAEL